MIRESQLAVPLLVCSLFFAQLPTAARGIEKGDIVVILSDTPLKVPGKTLTTLPRGGIYRAVAVQNNWVGLIMDQAGDTRTGWVDNEAVARVDSIEIGTRYWRLPTLPPERRPEWFGLFPPKEVEKLPLSATVEEWLRQHEKWWDGYANFAHSYGFAIFKPKGLYSIKVTGGTLVASNIIPGRDGQPRLDIDGKIYVMETLDINNNKVSSPILDGNVWTPRVERIGQMDLAANSNISSAPSFDFWKFRSAKDVIPFANGWAVNLYGAAIKDGAIANEQPISGYVTDEGKSLPGRVLRARVVQEDGVRKAYIEEVLLR